MSEAAKALVTSKMTDCLSEDEGPEDENAIWMAQMKAPGYWIGEAPILDGPRTLGHAFA